MADKGLYLFPSGPQNCTSACQEPDQLFREYKEKGDEETDLIVSERINQRASEESSLRNHGYFTRNNERLTDKKLLTKVELTNCDLPRIVNGRDGDDIERRPFSRAFAKEKVHAANAKVGAVPLTRAALLNPKVRKELERADEPCGIVQKIADAHTQNISAGQALGLQTASMEIDLPRRYLPLVAPPTAEEQVITKLVEGRCSAGSIWVNCGAVAFNAAVVNKAGCAILHNK